LFAVTVVFQFGLAGLAFGAIYALVALGIVVIHRGSGVVNFAQGAVGMVGTYLFWQLHATNGMAFAPAFVLSVLACAVIGLVIQFAIMNPMRDSSPLSRLLATLGILTALEAAINIKYPASIINLQSSLPSASVNVFGATVGEDRLTIIGITVALAIVLGGLYRYTRFGRATTAISENPLAASTLGYSPNRLGSYNWALGSALAGVAGILIAPITGLTATSLTLIVIPALAAAVVGNMKSFPVTVIAALVIGIAESETSKYISTPGWSSAVPLILVLVFLAIRGRSLPDRAHSRVKLPTVGIGTVRPPMVLLAIVVGVAVILSVPPAWVTGATTTLVVGILLLSVTVVTGYGGQLSLATYAMAGMGAYVAGRLSEAHGLPFLVCLLLGVAVALPIGMVVGLPALRTRGANLAIATLALSVGIEAVLFDSSSLTGGQTGTIVRSPDLFGLSIDPIAHPKSYAVTVFAFFVIVSLAVTNLRRSATGRRLLAVRANERAAASLGVGVVGSKLYAFSVGSMIAALGGILLAFQTSYVTYSDFTSLTSVNLVGDSVLGGLGFVGGAAPGALFQPGSLTSNVIGLFGDSVQNWLLLVSGLLLIVILITAPNGFAAQVTDGWRALVRHVPVLGRTAGWNPGAAGLDEIPVQSPVRPERPHTLRTDGLTVRFGDNTALSDVSLAVVSGQVLGLIGPNGAGKTTFIDAVTGFVRPGGGRVLLDDREISSFTPSKRARAGIARLFQSLELFEDMTIRENLLVASEKASRLASVLDLARPHRATLSPATAAAIAEFHLEDTLDRLPPELPYGRRRLVAIARAIADSPAVLMLDEPAAGLDEQERSELSTLVRRLADDWGMAILMIEHDVDLVMRTCDQVAVLEFGSVIASGSPEEVRTNRRVVESYLGESAAIEEASETLVPALSETNSGAELLGDD
jgi:ABC-type branched-subunit amino acid transport system ATPase component/branched-subunit amino acid ABC-type transport system permease component